MNKERKNNKNRREKERIKQGEKIQKYCQGIAYRFAKGNIILGGANGITIGEPWEQGIVFKFGSLVGLKMPAAAANGTAFQGAADVAFKPAGYTGPAITTDWATVPWCQTNFADYTNKSLNHLTAEHTPSNNLKGIGDICRYMGVVDGVTWHTPTAADFAELYGSAVENGNPNGIKRLGAWAEGSFTPLSGAAFGLGRNGVTLSGNNRVTNADPYTDGAVFWSASGWRHWDNGVVYQIGLGGGSWSATASRSDLGLHLWFTATAIIPYYSYFRTRTFPVRCIRD